MTKDYAKNKPNFSSILQKRNSRYQNNTHYSAGLPSWAWMSLGLAFGIALSSFIFWKLSHSSKSENLNLNIQSVSVGSEARLEPDAKTKNQTSKKTKHAKKTLTTDSKPSKRGDAENIKNIKTEQDNLAITIPETRFDFYTLLPTINVEMPEEAKQSHALPYIIQAGSFKTQEQAKQLKVALALQGREARVQTVVINASESWYRVYLGPFETKADALGVQRHLEEAQNLNSMVLKARV